VLKIDPSHYFLRQISAIEIRQRLCEDTFYYTVCISPETQQSKTNSRGEKRTLDRDAPFVYLFSWLFNVFFIWRIFSYFRSPWLLFIIISGLRGVWWTRLSVARHYRSQSPSVCLTSGCLQVCYCWLIEFRVQKNTHTMPKAHV